MGNFSINNGGVNTNKKIASVDVRYGPYDSTEAAKAALGQSGKDVITPGLTVGIRQNDGNIKEYWFKYNDNNVLDLVPKNPVDAGGSAQGHFAAFDENGNLGDSGNGAGDFAPIDQAVPSPDPTQDNGKILGYEAPTEGADPVVGWVEKPQDGVTPHIDDNTKEWMFGEKHTGVDAEGKDAYQVYVASVPSGTTPMTKTEWLDSLKGEKGDNAPQPFKGWFTPLNKPTSGKEGDYCYVTDNGVTNVYKWNGTIFEQTSDVPDTDHTQSFASSESVNQVAIDNSGLVNPVNTANSTQPVLAQAADVMQLKAKLQGVTASEEKGSTTLDYNGFIVCKSAGSQVVKTYRYDASVHTVFIPIPQGAKKLRFLGRFVNSDGFTTGYAFINAENQQAIEDNIIVSSGGSAKDISNYIVELHPWVNNGTTDNTEINDVAIPNGATYFCTIYGSGSITQSNFYCYLQSGTPAAGIDYVDNIKAELQDDIDSVTGKDIKTYETDDIINDTNFYINSYVTGCFYNVSEASSRGFGYYSMQSLSTRSNIVKGFYNNGYKSIVVTTNVNFNCYITFLKKYNPSSDKTLQELFDEGYLCDIHHEYNKPIRILPRGNEVEVDIPEDCKYIFFTRIAYGADTSSSTDRLPTKITLVKHEHIDGAVDEINERIDTLEEVVEPMSESIDNLTDTVYGEYVEETNNLDLANVPLERISLDSNEIYNFGSNASVHRAYVISLDGWDKVTITPGQYASYFGIFKKKIPVAPSGNVLVVDSTTISSEYKSTDCIGYTPKSGSVYRMVQYPNGSSNSPSGSVEITLSDNAKYLYIQKCWSNAKDNYSPSSVVLYRKRREGGLVDKDSESLITSSANVLVIEHGTLDNEGRIIEDATKLVTGFIPHSGGFYVELQDGYRVDKAMLYDTQGNLVNNLYYSRRSAFTTFYGNAKMLPQFMVRLVISRSDEAIIDTTDVVKKYFILSDSRFSRTIPTGLRYKEMMYRLNQLENVVWHNKTILKYITSSYYAPATWVGIPYSEAGEYTKYVGMHVSLKTYLTAVLNKRSVLYTENIQSNGSESKYGLTYHGLSGLSGTYYGTVCSGLTAYVHGDKNIIFANSTTGTQLAKGERGGDGLTTIQINDNGTWRNGTIDELFDLIEPLDYIWNTGHITIVSDVYKDAYGDKQFFVWSEQTTPMSLSTPFTKEMFLNRLNYIVNSTSNGSYKKWAIYRKDNWSNQPDMPDEHSNEYIQNSFFDYPKELSIDADISTFAGEYAAFSINSDNDNTDTYNNNKAFLNIHRGGNVYDRLQIFNESDDESIATPITVDISSNSGTFIYNSDNIYANDASDKDDWIIVDLTQLQNPLAHGKYKARVINSSNSEIVSGLTHFQMVDISFNITPGDNDTIVTTFKSYEGTPYLIRQEERDGMASTQYELTDSDVENETKTLSWSDFSYYNYVKLFVRADYGVVVKRINMSL